MTLTHEQSVLGDISNSSSAKKVPTPDKVLRRALATRLDAQAKCLASAPDLAAQYRTEVDTLATFLEQGERDALTTATDRAAALAADGPPSIGDLLKTLRTEFGSKVDTELLSAIGKAALASRSP